MAERDSGSESITSSGSIHGSDASSSGVQLQRGRAKRGRPSRRRPSGRGRGRGRGRGGQGRGRIVQPTSTAATDDRRDYIKTQIDQMSEDAVRDILHKAAERQPSIILDILDQRMSSQTQGGFHPPSANPDLPWCSCGNCRDMPTDRERVCCGHTPDTCLSFVPDFQVLILDEAVLSLARIYIRDVLVYPEDDNYNRANRHTAYRQFILWQYGRLTAGERKVIPSCCVWRVRDKFPDQYGQYVGFIPSRLE